MSTPRKVEIHQTDLMNWMERLLANCAPYRRAILAGVLAVIVVVAAYFIMQDRSARQKEDAWTSYFQSMPAPDDAKQLDRARDTVRALGNTEAGNSLQLCLGQELLDAGVNQLYIDREDGKKKLNEARALFTQVSQNSSQSILREPALLGLAQTEEALGDITAASKIYTELKEGFRNGLYSKLAEDRIAALRKPTSVEFYAWFKSAKLPQPGAGFGDNPFDRSSFLNLNSLPGGNALPGGDGFKLSPSPSPLESNGPAFPSIFPGTSEPAAPATDTKSTPPADPAAVTPPATPEATPAKNPAVPAESPAASAPGDKAAAEKSPAPATEPAKSDSAPATPPTTPADAPAPPSSGTSTPAPKAPAPATPSPPATAPKAK